MATVTTDIPRAPITAPNGKFCAAIVVRTSRRRQHKIGVLHGPRHRRHFPLWLLNVGKSGSADDLFRAARARG